MGLFFAVCFVYFLLMRIPVLDLRHGAAAFQAEFPTADLGLDAQRFPGSCVVAAQAHEQDQGWLLRLEIQAAWYRTCDRCLADLNGRSELQEQVLVLDTTRGGHELGDDLDQVLVVDADVQELDLDPSIREALVLDQPDYLLCSDECAGLCPDCGRDWNQNSCTCAEQQRTSPFAALKDLKTDETRKKD